MAGTGLNIDTSDRRDFYTENSEDYAYSVGAKFNEKGRLVIVDWAMGSIIEKTYIDSDIEHFLTIEKKDIQEFLYQCCKKYGHDWPSKTKEQEDILNLLMSIFKGSKNAMLSIKGILKNNDIPYRFDHW